MNQLKNIFCEANSFQQNAREHIACCLSLQYSSLTLMQLAADRGLRNLKPCINGLRKQLASGFIWSLIDFLYIFDMIVAP